MTSWPRSAVPRCCPTGVLVASSTTGSSPEEIILGVWKLLGGIAILLPRFALLKEWAYAGMIFDLTGAAASQAVAGDDVRHVVTPLVLAALVVASCALRPENRKLTQA